MKNFLIYTTARVGLLILCYAVFAGIWMAVFQDEQGILLWPFLAAVVASSVLSLKLLRGPRERFAASVDSRARRASQRFEDLKSREDAD